MLGVQAVRSAACIARSLTRRCGVSQEGIGGRIHLREPFGHCATGSKGVVTAGIQNDDICAVFSRLEATRELSNVQRVVAHILCIVERLVHG